MTEAAAESLSVVVERELSHPPSKVWRALTQPHLIAEWFMKADFAPVIGHRFAFHAEWGSVDCEVREVEAGRRLSYTLGDHDLKSVVTFILAPSEAGTRLRMEQTGFRRDQPRYFGGAQAGWPRFLDNLEQLLAGID